MAEPTHTREEKWTGPSFSSMEEIADFLEELIGMVVDAGQAGLSTEVAAIWYPDKQYPRMPIRDFRDLAPALPLDGADVFLTVEPGGLPRPVGVELIVWGGGRVRVGVGLNVKGQNEVAVNGIFVAVKERVEAVYKRRQRAEAIASKEATVEAPEPTWRKVLYNPYAVQVGGGLVVLLVGVVIGLLISN
jgi:hypothetical protein